MTRRPVLIDLFCGAGGAARGYIRAGFDVIGVDVEPQPRYPGRFIRADALTFDMTGADAAHASPPCQGNSRLRAFHPELSYADLIPETRARLVASGLPYIIENVPGAKSLSPLIMLCGTMFDLGVIRHRWFESNCLIWSLPHLCAPPNATGARGVEPQHRRHVDADYITVAGHMFNAAAGRVAMDIPDLTRDELAQAIPPAYTEYLGAQILPYIRSRR